MKLKKFEGNPILSPLPGSPWEDLVTCNPGVIYDGGKFHMLYRAAGDDEDHVIRFGLAESADGFHFTRVSREPVFGPSADGKKVDAALTSARDRLFDREHGLVKLFDPLGTQAVELRPIPGISATPRWPSPATSARSAG